MTVAGVPFPLGHSKGGGGGFAFSNRDTIYASMADAITFHNFFKGIRFPHSGIKSGWCFFAHIKISSSLAT